MTKICSLSDEVSGITTLDDGTKVYWTEGYSDTVIVHPDGQKEIIPWGDNHPTISKIREIEEKGADQYTQATEAEETEYSIITNKPQ